MVARYATLGLLSAALIAPMAHAQPKDQRSEGNLKVGDKAPDFKLKSMDKKSEVQLAKVAEKKPVVLVFGSYT